MLGEGSEEVEGIHVGEALGTLEFQERGCDGQAQKTLLRGPTEVRRSPLACPIKSTTSELVVGMGREGQGDPHVGVKESARHAGDPPW